MARSILLGDPRSRHPPEACAKTPAEGLVDAEKKQVSQPSWPDGQTTRSNASAAPAMVLVVDDVEMNRELLGRRLARRGMQVLQAASGAEALGLLATHSCDLVLLDVEMPVMDGIAVLTRIRQTRSEEELPVIMVTARNASNDIVTALQQGANDYLTKPIDFPVMLARIRTHLARRRAVLALRESEERYALALRGSNNGLWDWDIARSTVFYSPRWQAMLGYQVNEIGNTPEDWFSKVHPDDLPTVESSLAQHLSGCSLQFECEYRMQHRDGTYRWMLGRGIAVRDRNGDVVRMAGSQFDTTEGKVLDALTRLPNRHLFLDLLERTLDRARRRPDYNYGVLFLDLDRFKLINDSLGHTVGDRFLIEVARRIRTALVDSVRTTGRAEPFLARLGGDEFAILIDDIPDASEADQVAERIQESLRKPFVTDGHEVVSGASIGIVLNVRHYERAEELLRDADNAMYRAKAAGGGTHVVFDRTMHERALARLRMEADLRRAIKEDQLTVYYQPLIDMTTGRIYGFEALVRWFHPDRGRISPGVFIPIAEETGLINAIGRFVFRRSCKQLRAFRDLDLPGASDLTMSVNVSRRQFSEDLVGFFQQTANMFDLPPESITLEITETTAMGDRTAVGSVLETLRALGMKLSMDDFGTGYSSLSILHQLPFNILKIDRAFIMRVEEDRTLVQTIIQLGKNLGLSIVAEGVETPEQHAIVQEMGCDAAQGYLYSKPMSPTDMIALLETQPRW